MPGLSKANMRSANTRLAFGPFKLLLSENKLRFDIQTNGINQRQICKMMLNYTMFQMVTNRNKTVYMLW